MKKFKPFADVVKVICTDKLRPALNYAIVEGSKLIATNTHILAVINLAEYFEPEQLEILEGKAFTADLVKKMTAAARLEVKETEIIIFNKKGAAERAYYSAVKNEKNGSFEMVDQLTGKPGYDSFKFVNWRAVVPYYKDDTFNFDELQPAPLCFNVNYISAAGAALNSENIIFMNGAKNRPTILLATKYDEPKKENSICTDSFVLIMPVTAPIDKIYSPAEPAAADNTALTILAAERLAEIQKLEKKAEAMQAATDRAQALEKKAEAMQAAIDRAQALEKKAEAMQAAIDQLTKELAAAIEPAAAPETAPEPAVEPEPAPAKMNRKKRFARRVKI